MPAVLVELDPETYDRLAARAERSGVTVPDLVAFILTVEEAASVDAATTQLIREVVAEYSPVLDRLAE
jgi:hypothetical protein